MAEEVGVWCWKCVKRPVVKVFDVCRTCVKQEDRRFSRAKLSDNHWSEDTHMKHRAPLEALDAQNRTGESIRLRVDW